MDEHDADDLQEFGGAPLHTLAVGTNGMPAHAPSIFIAQEPQMPSRHERRKVSVVSISFLILISASRTIGPHSFRSSS